MPSESRRRAEEQKGADMIRFTLEQQQFIEKEFGISAQQLAGLKGDDLLTLQDRCFDIELEGDLKSDGKGLSKRSRIASDIISLIDSSDPGEPE